MALGKAEIVAKGRLTSAMLTGARWSKGILRFARRNPLGATSAAILLLIGVVAIFADFIAPYSPYARQTPAPFAPPSAEYILGTDQFGRDLFSRIIYGARNSLRISISAVAMSSVMGIAIGLTSGYFRGTYDMLMQRFVDVLQAFPLLIIALAIVAVLGPSVPNVIIAIAIGGGGAKGRTVRSLTLSLREVTFVDAARSIGASNLRIMMRHVLPNTYAVLIIGFTSALAGAILTEASLSFLGLGVTEPEPSWGLMLSGSAATYVRLAPWVAFFPGLAITITVLTFNLLGDALRDILDPKLRGR